MKVIKKQEIGLIVIGLILMYVICILIARFTTNSTSFLDGFLYRTALGMLVAWIAVCTFFHVLLTPSKHLS